MTIDNNSEFKNGAHGLDNTIQQNHGLEEDIQNKDSENKLTKPVDNGGVKSSDYDLKLEEQWLAVRDEYLAHYPYVLDSETVYEKGGFYTIIENLAKKRELSSKEIHDEILNWNSNK